MRLRPRPKQSGFTLIEMIVSLGVFSVVVTIAVGALLILIASNRQLQDEQSILSNLSFALDSMTRDIRTGTHYYCDAATSYGGFFTADTDGIDTPPSTFATQDCPDGAGPFDRVQGISFVEGGDSLTGTGGNRVLFFFRRDTNPRVQGLYRKIGTGVPQKLVSDGIYISNAQFFVTGSAPLDTASGLQTDQASVTIYLEAAATSTPGAKLHLIQTSVTQRTLDV